MTYTKIPFILLASTLALSSYAADEPIHPGLDNGVTVKVGYLKNEAEGDLTYTKDSLAPTPVSLEDIGITEAADSASAEISWRFHDKWNLNLVYNGYEQSGATIVSDPFNFGGSEFQLDAIVESNLAADAYILNLGYSFLKGENYEIGAGLGVHTFDFDASLDGHAETHSSVSVSKDLVTPVPNARVFANYAVNPKILVSVDAGWMSLDYDDYSGSFLNATAGVEYLITPHFSGGVAYQYTDIDVEYDSEDKAIDYNMNFDGLLASISYRF